MARQQKDGLDYFPLDVDFFEDEKIKILRARYGTDGIAVYLYLLCRIFRNGYYIKTNDDFEYILSTDLKMSVDKARQVLTFLLSRSLFNDKLFQSDAVLTSAGIQRRFQLAVRERAKKTPVKVGRFWLLSEEETRPFIKCTLFGGSSWKKEDSSGKKEGNSPEKSLKESKVNIYDILRFHGEVESAFQTYLRVRERLFGEIPEEQVSALRRELCSLAEKDADRIEIIRKATSGGWKTFYPVSAKRSGGAGAAAGSRKKKAGGSVRNFHQREYDYGSLEAQLLGGRDERVEEGNGD